ncbi:hypothetical protein A2U01_0110703, partial [Trifolium medium]|nr:hypothetical protein [Trifolium medium]
FANNASSSSQEAIDDDSSATADAKANGSHVLTSAQYDQLMQLLQHSSLTQSSSASSNQ